MNRRLCDKDAIPAAHRIYDYLCSLDGRHCLTGQMESNWCGTQEHEINYLVMRTGRMPAIRGLDFLDNDFNGVVRRAVDWHARGGIVTICWHTGPDFASSYHECKEHDLDWEAAFTDGSPENRSLLTGMDRAVPYLRRLQEMGVPVLWRPFHEMDGGWFWWGRGGRDRGERAVAFTRLWRMMYDRYTHIHGLHNLIWVLGFSDAPGDLAPWYPGDDCVDILGGDSYQGGAQGDLYRKCAAIAPEGMPVCYHENGEIPTSAMMQEEGAPWEWFMTWHTRWLTSEEFNTGERLREVYEDSYFVTLNALPDFTH